MRVLQSVALAPRSTLGVGGPARFFVSASDEQSVIDALAWSKRRGIPCRVLGGGSNLVIADRGFDGLVLQIELRGLAFDEFGGEVQVRAAAGESWDELVALTAARGYSGLECLSGIPGQVGATPIQNVGAYGHDVSDRLGAVRAVDRQNGRVVELLPETCRFAYRDSLFKSAEPERYVVVGVALRLTPGGRPELRHRQLREHLDAREIAAPTPADVRSSVLEIRRSKAMLWDPESPDRRSCGSFFLNPVLSAETYAKASASAEPRAIPHFPTHDGRVKVPAAWLIEQAGFSRGQRFGSVGISSCHTLALVCHDGARAEDLVQLARRIRVQVRDRFGVCLMPEPSFWGFERLEDGLPTQP